ncbi:MAG: tetratricopeptide repeat protein [Dehalococcoidia bacterium]
MRCPSCQTENPKDATFCGECGTALVKDQPCPSCARLNPHNVRFCHGCGTALVESSPARATTPSVVLSELPTSLASGRYQVKKFLGEGGKKKVYLTHDNVLDRDVAFSLIKTEGLDETGRTRIVREAQAMGRLGSHPHIVTVFDLGEHEGQPYMVAELMNGGDLEGVIENATDHNLPLEECLDIGKTVCRALERPAEHGPLRCLSAMVAFNSGDIEQGAKDEEFLTTWGTGPALKAYHEHLQFALTISLIQRMGGRAENLSLARKSAESVLSNPSLVPLWKADAVAALALLANKEEVELLRECYRTLLPGHTMLACGLAGLTSGDRILGLVSQVLGDFNQATSHFEDALDLCRRAGYRPELAWTLHDYAQILLERNRPEDRQKATALLEEALQISRDLGMKPLMERVLSKREILGA